MRRGNQEPENRWEKFGRELAECSSRFTNSPTERRVLEDVGLLIAQGREVIAAVQEKCDGPLRYWIARNIYQLVVQAPPGGAGQQLLHQMFMQHRSDTDFRYAAPWVAWLLVAATDLVVKAQADGMAAGLHVTALQGEIETFLVNQGVRGWEVPLVSAGEFNALRQARPSATAPLTKKERLTLNIARYCESHKVARSTQVGLQVEGDITTIVQRMMEQMLSRAKRSSHALSGAERLSVSIAIHIAVEHLCGIAEAPQWELASFAAGTAMWVRQENDVEPVSQHYRAAIRLAEAMTQADAGQQRINRVGHAVDYYWQTLDEQALDELCDAVFALLSPQ